MRYMLVILIPLCAGVVCGYLIPSGSFTKSKRQNRLGSATTGQKIAIIENYPEIEENSITRPHPGLMKKRGIVLSTIKPGEIYESGDTKAKGIDIRSFILLRQKFKLKDKAASLLNEQFMDNFNYKHGYFKPTFTKRLYNLNPSLPTQSITEGQTERKHFYGAKNYESVMDPSHWNRLAHKKAEEQGAMKDKSQIPMLPPCRKAVIDTFANEFPYEFIQQSNNVINEMNTKGGGKPRCKCHGKNTSMSIQ